MITQKQQEQEQEHAVGSVESVTMRHLDSTSLCCVGYAASRQEMFVRFNSSPVIYSYSNITPLLWQEFQMAPSRGSWVATTLVAQPLVHPVTKFVPPYNSNQTGLTFNFVRPASPLPTFFAELATALAITNSTSL